MLVVTKRIILVILRAHTTVSCYNLLFFILSVVVIFFDPECKRWLILVLEHGYYIFNLFFAYIIDPKKLIK